jgi:hypothetical protein
MDLSAIRAASLVEAAKSGIFPPPHFPLLDPPHLKNSDQAVDRLLCLNATAAVSYGLPRETAKSWLEQEELWSKLEDEERQFLADAVGNKALFQWQPEGIFVLAWSVGMFEKIDLWEPCPNDLVFRLPDLKSSAPTAGFRSSLTLRSAAEIVSLADLAFCIHWGVRDARLKGRRAPGDVEELQIMERRRALDWLIEGENWYSMRFDT